jgi:hypothetical protein
MLFLLLILLLPRLLVGPIPSSGGPGVLLPRFMCCLLLAEWLLAA